METNKHFSQCLMKLKEHVFPRQALAPQKCYMHCFLHKPHDLTICEFITCLVEINEWLKEFPPTMGMTTKTFKLPDEELIDIAEFAIPSIWQCTMVMHDFDPVIHTSQEFISFCERIKFSEGSDPSTKEMKS